MSKLTSWIPESKFPSIRRSLECYDVPSDVADALLADRDNGGGIYVSTVVDRASVRGWRREIEQALGIE